MTLSDAHRSHASERLGLHLSEERLLELQRFVTTRAQPARRPPEAECEDFLNGETYFFRYPFFLSLLAGRLEAGGGEPFRVLCPACSTGEEVYSLAFVLGPAARRRGRPLEIVGSDVRPKAVRSARDGVFGVWSLRNTPPPERPKYFDVPQEGRFRIKDEFRPFVRFAVRNLLDAIDEPAFDAVVLCNATLYMHERAARAAYTNVHAALKPEGLLLIAPTDPPPGAAIWRHCPEYGGWSVYRPIPTAGAGDFGRARAALEGLELPWIAPLPEPAPFSARPSRGRTGARKPSAKTPRVSGSAGVAARPKDAGRAGVPRASLWSLQPDDAALWGAWASGQLASVEPRIREKVFFEPDNPLWRFLRGACLWELGWLRRARRELAEAERLLAAFPSDQAVSGLCTAAELRRVMEEWGAQHG
jgi:chemotaxis methyl-accepting protein methylase